MFHKEVDKTSREAMIDFLAGHFRYYTMNRWNRSKSYANNVKVDNLDIPKEQMDMAYDIACRTIDDMYDYDKAVELIMNEFLMKTGYAMGFNGRSGGYLVLYETQRKEGTNQMDVMIGRTVGYENKDDFEDWEDCEIKELVEVVEAFDKACDDIRDKLLETLNNYRVEERVVMVPTTEKVLVSK
jgi:hypothetical protein